MSERAAADDHERVRTILPRFPEVPPGASLGERFTAFTTWLNATRFLRTVQENARQGAPVMAAGMAYMGLFSVFSGLWAVFSILGLIFAGRADLHDLLISSLSEAVPGLIGEGGAIDPATLLSAGVFGWTGAISLVSTIWTALNWLNGARIAIRTIFELPPSGPVPFVLAKLRDLGLIIGALVLIVLSSVFMAAGSGAVTWLLGMFGVGGDWVVREFLIQAAGFVVAALVDAVLLAGMVRVLSSVRVPMRVLVPAALVGGVATTLIKALATMLVGGATANPLLASFAVLLSVLILFNLFATVQLLVASWVKVSLDDLGYSPRALTAEEATEEARATAVRAQQELLAAEELRLREFLRTAPRFTPGRMRAARRLGEITDERLALERRDLDLRMWGDKVPSTPSDPADDTMRSDESRRSTGRAHHQ